MTKQHSKSLKLMLGQYDVSAYFKDSEVAGTRDEAEVTNFASAAKEFLIGHTDGTVSLGGFLDLALGAIAEQLEAMIGQAAGTAFTECWQGNTVLHNFAAVLSLKLTKVSPKSAVGSAVLLDVEGRADAGPDFGILLRELASAVVAVETSRTGYDYGSGDTTSNGFIANLHVTGISVSPTLACRLQDSANSTNGVDGAWADVTGGAFTNISAVGSQCLTGTTSVRRWVRATYVVTGTGLLNFMVSFAKKR